MNSEHTRLAIPDDIDRITALIAHHRNARTLPSVPPVKVTTAIRRDIETAQGGFHWLITESTGDTLAATRIAVIPAPPIYDLKGGMAGAILDQWLSPANGSDVDTIVAAAEAHMRERGAVVFVAVGLADQTTLPKLLDARGYRSTTQYMAKTTLKLDVTPADVRPAAESDIPYLVAFNREARERLHEANPDFWTSHPEADARFGLWMKFSLTMRDRAMLVTQNGSGFIIAQPASPIQLPITGDLEAIGVIDDFHDAAFGRSLTQRTNDSSAAALLAAAENDFIARGKTASLAICPVAWPAKKALLTRAGYEVHHTWFVKPLD